MRRSSDAILRWMIQFLHERLGLSPNQISTVGLLFGMTSAGLVAAGFLTAGLIVLALSQIVDGIDGGVARRYNLQSETGQLLEVIFDRSNEVAIFLALAFVGEVSYRMAVLACISILLVTIVEPKSKFDPGFKRFILYFGYLATLVFHIRGFEAAMHVIFLANLIGFVVGTIMVDYRLQKEIDTQSMLRREQEIAVGMPQPPDDAPSFLSRLFA